MMFREECDWNKVSVYIGNAATTVFVGPNIDERSAFFPEFFKTRKCQIIRLECSPECKELEITVSELGHTTFDSKVEFLSGLINFLNQRRQDIEVACMDITSLQHPVIMYLTKILLKDVQPKQLFATYAEPIEYRVKDDLGGFHLSDESLGLRAVPGFSLRARSKEVRLLAFLGFEGRRFRKIVEEANYLEIIIPVIGFPSFRPGWQSRALKNCMRTIKEINAFSNIYKCNASSVFEAYDMIQSHSPPQSKTFALAPIGTRPHTLACAIYATRHEKTQIIYDNPIETVSRSNGIYKCLAFHLTGFIL